MGNEIDPARVREAVARARHQDVQSGYGVADPEDVELLATAALDALTQRDTVRELSEATASWRRTAERMTEERDEWKAKHEADYRRHGEAVGRLGDTNVSLRLEINQLRSELDAVRAQRHLARVEASELRSELEAANEALADKRRLTRELDVAMHGEEGAAKQASLCDLIPLAKRLLRELEAARAERDQEKK